MGYSYKPLWCLLSEKGMSKTEFRQKVGLSTATLAKLSENKTVSPDVLARICNFFSCKLEEVVEYFSDTELFMSSIENYILGWDYNFYPDKWADYMFKLTQPQCAFLSSLSPAYLKDKILRFELKSNEEISPNVGIIGTTQLRFDGLEQKLIISGSLSVVEKFMLWFIEESK